MTQKEFAQWKAFHDLYPFDDLHRIHRPAAVMSAVHTKAGDMRPFLHLLQPEASMREMTDADRTTMAAFGYAAKPATK
jgi:hypothetical protein